MKINIQDKGAFSQNDPTAGRRGVNRMEYSKYSMFSDDKNVSKALYYREDSSSFGKLEVTVRATGGYAGGLLEMAEEMLKSILGKAQEELKEAGFQRNPRV